MKRIGLMFTLTSFILSACEVQNYDIAMNQHHEGHETKVSHTMGHGEDQLAEEAKHEADHVKAIWSFPGGLPSAARQNTTIQIKIEQHGQPIEQFDISHEKKLHLIIVSKDLSYFNHVHPVYKGKGVFEISNVFPAGGDYKLIADFVPTGGRAINEFEWIHISGEQGEAIPLEPDTALSTIVDGKLVTLQFDKKAVGQESMFTFTFADETTKQPITDLQPYLGAVGHVVILGEHAKPYLHVHPMDEGASGPEAQFMTTFPENGIYKIWGQFKQGGRVFTVPFVVNVP